MCSDDRKFKKYHIVANWECNTQQVVCAFSKEEAMEKHKQFVLSQGILNNSSECTYSSCIELEDDNNQN